MATIVSQTVANGDYTAWIDVTVTSQNVANNTSNINVKFYVKCSASYNNSAYNLGSVNRFIQLNWDGDTDVGHSGPVDTRNKVTVLLQEANYTIWHNADGNKTITIAGSCSQVTSSLTAFMIYGNFTLPAINTRPNNITVFDVSPNPAESDQSCVLSWSGATVPNYAIDYYNIQCRRYTGGAWGSYVTVVNNEAASPYTHNIANTFPTLKDGDRIQYKVFTHSTSGQLSTGVECVDILDVIIPSSVRIRIGGVWKKGIVWVRVAGVWRKGKIWKKIAGIWEIGK